MAMTQNEPAPEPDAAEEVEFVTIPRAELEALRSMAGSPSGRGVAAADDGTSALREEMLNREIEARDRRVVDLEAAYRKALRDRELATALAGRPLVGGAAAQLIKLWRDDFDVYEESGEYRVASRDGRTAAQWIADRLGGPEYAHFCLPSSRGGVGAKGLSQAGASDGPATSARTLGEAVISQWRESAAARGGATPNPAGWGRRR